MVHSSTVLDLGGDGGTRNPEASDPGLVIPPLSAEPSSEASPKPDAYGKADLGGKPLGEIDGISPHFPQDAPIPISGDAAIGDALLVPGNRGSTDEKPSFLPTVASDPAARVVVANREGGGLNTPTDLSSRAVLAASAIEPGLVAAELDEGRSDAWREVCRGKAPSRVPGMLPLALPLHLRPCAGTRWNGRLS